jgi:PAS domain-containing protein
MLPSSHVFPMNAMSGNPIPSPQLLADAFSEFISASSVLEESYRDLQLEVKRLSSELSKRNADLTRSLAENDRMRATLQQMLDSMPCGVLVLSSDQRIVMINPEGRSLLELGNAKIDNLRKLSRDQPGQLRVAFPGIERRGRQRSLHRDQDGQTLVGNRQS